ncbi:MAG: hypothetical protein IPK15_22045 [Verrucomicrobia bacterium]|nr:hypothetical protein [Verrucomicrobiota bacterium]
MAVSDPWALPFLDFRLPTPLPVDFVKFDVADAIQYEEALKLTAAQLAKHVVPFLKLAN